MVVVLEELAGAGVTDQADQVLVALQRLQVISRAAAAPWV